MFLVVITMAFLSLSLKHSTNRWANVVVGAIIAILEFLVLTQALTDIYAPVLLMSATKVVIAASIVWLAYKWPKPMA